MEKQHINRKENRASEPSGLVKMMNTERPVASIEKKPAQTKYKRVNHLYKLL
ncbi:hypothetical protein [Pedobacter sp. GR22-6]|uniref:hypothetical protein n=1 Tax=Pedobacter sp. GR22-6 TaxID=3127957 RepID=UPI00307D0D6E